jgi:hypothetical protein
MAEILMPMSRRALAPAIEAVALSLAKSSEGRPVKVATKLTEKRRRQGRGRMPHALPLKTCRMCGEVLADPEREVCDECLPQFKADRTTKLVNAAKRTLAEMRSSEADPAQTPEAKAKRVAAFRKRKQTAKEWERANPGPHDREDFVRDVLPGLSNVTLPAMMKATGLSSRYCFQIKRGERVPHAMYWDALRDLASAR